MPEPDAHDDTHARPALVPVQAQRHAAGRAEAVLDWVAEEVPVALEYNGISHAVMLASPIDLDDFARGFSLSEGIVERAGELLDLEVHDVDDGIRIEMRLPASRFEALKGRRRNLAGRTGCGLCGVDSLRQVLRQVAPVDSAVRVAGAALVDALSALEQAQVVRQLTGATHAAGWLAADARGVAFVREDVGRHNALDKVVGALARSGLPAGQGALLLTSRASVEMVQKAAAAGIAIVAARGAPTALAVRRARELGVTLAGFVQRERLVAYSQAARLSGAAGPIEEQP